MKKLNQLAALILGLTLSSNAFAGSAVYEAAKKIAGTYTGKWAMYGVQNGAVVQKSSWTDVLTAANPTEGKGRAFVDVSSVMTYPDGKTRTSVFQEGYFENSDGSVGDRFYEIQGQTVIFKRLTPNDWTYQVTPNEGELWFLGFDPKTVISASHVAAKTTTYEGGIDTDHVSRLTTVQWKDANGAIQTIQFVSMKGEHTRIGQ